MSALSDDHLGSLRGLLDYPDLTGTRYEIRRKLAVGGMGSVYLAHDRALDRNVALKVLTIPDLSGERAARMMREAHVVARLEHPGIVPIHDVGRLSDGRVYYTMKYVEGATLEQFRQPETPLPDLLRLFQRVCEAVEFAHSRGVIHRDLKPANIMVGPFGEVLVMDWGIALAATLTRDPATTTPDSRSERASEAGHPVPGGESAGSYVPTPNTAAGTILGTPAYMSPEQARGETVDHRCDIHGLGAILYFLLTGRAPFEVFDSPASPDRIRRGEVTPPRTHDRRIPRRLEAICLKAIAPSPDDRYQSARHFTDDIVAYLDGLPVSAYRETPWEVALRWFSRNRFIVFIVVAYMVVRFLLLLWRGI